MKIIGSCDCFMIVSCGMRSDKEVEETEVVGVKEVPDVMEVMETTEAADVADVAETADIADIAEAADTVEDKNESCGIDSREVNIDDVSASSEPLIRGRGLDRRIISFRTFSGACPMLVRDFFHPD